MAGALLVAVSEISRTHFISAWTHKNVSTRSWSGFSAKRRVISLGVGCSGNNRSIEKRIEANHTNDLMPFLFASGGLNTEKTFPFRGQPIVVLFHLWDKTVVLLTPLPAKP